MIESILNYITSITNLFRREPQARTEMSTIDLSQYISHYAKPVVSEEDYIDPEYVTECFIDLEFDFIVGDEENYMPGYIPEGYGVRYIHIKHDTLQTRANQIDCLLEHSQKMTRMFEQIDAAIQKIKLQCPNFEYHIHHNERCYYGDNHSHGTQIFRIVSPLSCHQDDIRNFQYSLPINYRNLLNE